MAKTTPNPISAQFAPLPSPDSFAPVDVTAPAQLALGTAVGVPSDYVSAYINLKERPDRVAKFRRRMQQQGYQVAAGYEIVGVPDAEVWVMPRSRYLQLCEARHNRTVQGVREGRISNFAIRQPMVDYLPPAR